VPLSLTAQQLSPEEARTYMRWYLDILARANLRTIAISDVYQFLGNFRLAPATRAKINRVFSKILLLINIGEFFAVLRVVAHALQGREPARALIQTPTRVPRPPSILSQKRPSDDAADDTGRAGAVSAPLDIDLFTQFLLTGERPTDRGAAPPRKRKSVKFCDQLVSDIRATPAPAEPAWDDLLPMDQLMSRMHVAAAPAAGAGLLAVPWRNAAGASPDPEERQILRDMAPQMNHFRNLHSVDTILVGGVPATIHLPEHSDLFLPRNALPQPPLLRPNMTGPAQMAQMGPPPLRPNATGPHDMARFLSPPPPGAPRVSLQAFTSQMAGPTVDNTQQNARIGAVSPPPTPASRRARSASLPSPGPLAWDPPAGRNSAAFNPHLAAPAATPGPPVPARSLLGHAHGTPPPPPPRSRRAGSTSSPVPPPLPAKIPNAPLYQAPQGSSSTTDILDDLKALQEEVDKIRDLTGGF
ncbi:hypothetical protein METBIDRAFT_25721, partial [Metschnikowia bicuspidata var. bicuspidata NRRL YB-4993]